MSKLPESNLSADNEATQQKTVTTLSSDVHLEVGGDLQPSDYLYAVPVSQKTGQAIEDWVQQRQEVTRAHLSMWLVKLFSCSLAATFVLMGVAIFNPEVNQSALKDLLLLVIPPQTTLLGGAFGYYFGAKGK